MVSNMTNQPKVSVIIPVYNAEKTLKQCLDSVVSQDFENFEIIVVDNNSTDGSKGIIDSFLAGRKVKYFFEEKRGRGAARNTGLRVARGEIIAMTDADCIVSVDWLKRLTEPVIQDQAQAVMGFFEPAVKNFWAKNIQENDLLFFRRNLDGEFINTLDTKNFAIEVNLIKKFMFDSSLENFEDFDLFLRLRNQRQKILFLLKIVVQHYHPQSFSQVVSSNFDRGFWLTKIYFKYRKDKKALAHPMFVSISWRNFFSWPVWLITKIFSLKPGRFWYLVVSEFAWRSGIIWFFLNRGQN